MRCLYVVSEDPISPNYRGGASSIYYEQLLTLAELGHQVHLWHQATPDQRRRFDDWVRGEPDTWQEVKSRCVSVELTTSTPVLSVLDRALLRARQVTGLGLPRPPTSLRSALEYQMQRTQPDVIWAQHYEPTVLATSQRNVPVVYSHHDWLYRIKALRNGRPEDWRRRAVERRLVRRVAVAVSGSATECEELRAAGCPKVHYIPVSYPMVDIDWSTAALGSPRLVHLGGMFTTANREGLIRFFDFVWPHLKPDDFDFEVIGDITAAPAHLKAQLARVRCLGFQTNLQKVLRPADLHIIAWEHNTGQRTRLPLAFNHGQVVVATRASVACFPEAVDMQNCRLVDRLEEMPGAIRQLATHHELRMSLARSARQTFEDKFTRKSLLPRYTESLAPFEPVPR